VSLRDNSQPGWTDVVTSCVCHTIPSQSVMRRRQWALLRNWDPCTPIWLDSDLGQHYTGWDIWLRASTSWRGACSLHPRFCSNLVKSKNTQPQFLQTAPLPPRQLQASLRPNAVVDCLINCVQRFSAWRWVHLASAMARHPSPFSPQNLLRPTSSRSTQQNSERSLPDLPLMDYDFLKEEGELLGAQRLFVWMERNVLR
jgi:hypothetical protein